MPMREDYVAGKFFDPKIMAGFRMDFLAKTVGASEALLATYPPVLLLDPNGGAKTVTLPDEASAEGLFFLIFNSADAAETLTVDESTGSTAVLTLTQGLGGLVFCDGTQWWAVTGA